MAVPGILITNLPSYGSTNDLKGKVLNGNPTNVISSWSYRLTVPQTGDENVRLNLWLFQGNPPTDNEETEVIMKSFQLISSMVKPKHRAWRIKKPQSALGTLNVRLIREAF